MGRERRLAAGIGRGVSINSSDLRSSLGRLQAGAPNPSRLRLILRSFNASLAESAAVVAGDDDDLELDCATPWHGPAGSLANLLRGASGKP
jgi:hypothetical protein